MINSRCCGQIVHVTQGVLAVNSNVGRMVTGLAGRLYSSKGKGEKCSENIPQTEGREMEPWPKPDPPPPAWRDECPRGPQPPNYDPYRIKVPEVVVPPLPPSNAKAVQIEDSGDLFQKPDNFGNDRVQDLFHNSPFVHPDYWKDKPGNKLSEAVKEVLPKLGYHGRNKYKYAFHEPWNPLDRLTLLEQAEKQELEQIEANDNSKQSENEAV